MTKIFSEFIKNIIETGPISIGDCDSVCSKGLFIKKDHCVGLKTSLDIALIELSKSKNKAIKASLEDLKVLSFLLGDTGRS